MFVKLRDKSYVSEKACNVFEDAYELERYNADNLTTVQGFAQVWLDL